MANTKQITERENTLILYEVNRDSSLYIICKQLIQINKNVTVTLKDKLT